MRVVMRPPASIGEALNAAFLIAIEDLIAGFARNPKLPAKFRHRLAGLATNCILSSMTERSFQGISPSLQREEVFVASVGGRNTGFENIRWSLPV